MISVNARGRMVLTAGTDGMLRVVSGEVVIPNFPDALGTIYSEDTVRDIANTFALNGYALNVRHGTKDVKGDLVHVLESYIAEPGNVAGFSSGAWVLTVAIDDDLVWADILSGRLTGFSYEAMAIGSDCVLEVDADKSPQAVVGETLLVGAIDTHQHDFYVVLNTGWGVYYGSTSVEDGHSHKILRNVVTEPSEIDGHVHFIDIQQYLRV